MSFQSISGNAPEPQPSQPMIEQDLRKIVNRLSLTLERDDLVQQTLDQLRGLLQVDRVVLYYFYRPWRGQVTCECLSQARYSIMGSTGPDECFNDGYAKLYLAGRVRAIADIEQAAIADCHRDFLRQLQVRANLSVPILVRGQLWGLLIAHHCQAPYEWTEANITAMQQGAKTLAQSPLLQLTET